MPTFHFDLVSPERLLFSGEVDQVDLPGADGDFGVLAGHAPTLAALRPGVVTMTGAGRQERILVLGGFAEISPAGLTLLADAAMSAAKPDGPVLEAAIRAAQDSVASAPDGAMRDRAERRLDELSRFAATAGA